MKEYFYLDADNKPQGPKSRDELASMLQEGALAADTRVAAEGDRAWVPLETLLQEEEPPAPEEIEVPAIPPMPAPMPAAASGVMAGSCPGCNHPVNVENGQLPERCRHCGRALRPTTPGIWQNFRLALRQYARFTGRATRAEFWSFVLVSYLIQFAWNVIATVAPLVILAATMLENDYALDPLSPERLQGSSFPENIGPLFENSPLVVCCVFIMYAAVILGFLTQLFFLVPSLSVAVRRLNDAGWSGLKWMLTELVLLFATVGGVVWVAVSENAETWSLAWLIVTLAVSLALVIISVVCFIVTLLDSQRGRNAYGPSAKYPLG